MKAITANRLTDGRVVYRCRNGAWTEALGEARLFAGEAEGQVALAEAAFDHLTVVDPYFIDVDDASPAGQKAVRESIRHGGPSAGSLHTGLLRTNLAEG